MTPEFTRAGLLDALEELSTIMESRGEQGRVYVVGGAAMILAHSADRATRDIDAAIEHGFTAVTEAARIVAQRRGWPRTWLNEGATVFMPQPPQRRGAVIFDHPALKVIAATTEHMLAMKARAARPTDRSDVELLLRESNYTSIDQIEDTVNAVFPDEPLGPRQRRWLTALLDALQPQAPHAQPDLDNPNDDLSPGL